MVEATSQPAIPLRSRSGKSEFRLPAPIGIGSGRGLEMKHFVRAETLWKIGVVPCVRSGDPVRFQSWLWPFIHAVSSDPDRDIPYHPARPVRESRTNSELAMAFYTRGKLRSRSGYPVPSRTAGPGIPYEFGAGYGLLYTR